jgi:hypothetical protein
MMGTLACWRCRERVNIKRDNLIAVGREGKNKKVGRHGNGCFYWQKKPFIYIYISEIMVRVIP